MIVIYRQCKYLFNHFYTYLEFPSSHIYRNESVLIFEGERNSKERKILSANLRHPVLCAWSVGSLGKPFFTNLFDIKITVVVILM